MHDPQTLAFSIYFGSKEKKNGHYRYPIIEIWHCDPDLRGDDDSCGWFMRSRHINPAILEKVRKEFAFNFKHNYWFNADGTPVMSTLATTVNMYTAASWHIQMFLHNNKPTDRARRAHHRFISKHLYDIMYFAENPVDSLNSSIDMRFGSESEAYRIDNFTSIITADIFRKMRPWYKHPKWHIHHWRITFPLFRSWYRRYIERCDRCRERFKRSSVYTDWNGTENWCSKCNSKRDVPTINLEK